MICWKQGGGTTDYVKPNNQPWLSNVTLVSKGEFKGLIPFEKALIAHMEYKYPKADIMYINKFDKDKLQQNDVNFLVSLNLLTEWEKGPKPYKAVLKLMKDPTISLYPNLKEQYFLFDKGGYLEYFKKKGVPIAPSFTIYKSDSKVDQILKRVKQKGWSDFVLKPHWGYANAGIGKFTTDNKNTPKYMRQFLTKHKQYPGFVCQEVMEGFAKFWEIKSLWIQGKFRYYVAMKAADKVFRESYIYGTTPDGFGKAPPQVLRDIKKMGKTIINCFPKLNPKSKPPMYLRLDFGCCRGNTMDGSSYFLNEVEYAGCAIFSNEAEGIDRNKVLDIWGKAYYEKALDYVKTPTSTRSKRSSRKRTKKTRRKIR